VFIDHADKTYLSISGRAQIVDDPELRATAWRKNDAVWWPDPTIPTCVFSSSNQHR